MTEPKTRTQYVHVNSKHRLETAENLADLKIHLQQPIKNCYRCFLKSFTIANHLYNIRSGENTLSWAEFFQAPGGSGYAHKDFTITIPTGYYTTDDLCSEINTQIQTMSGHTVSSDLNETPLNMSFTQNSSTYRVFVSLENGYGTKYFAPINRRNSIWRMLGFVDRQVVNLLKRKADDLNDIGVAITDGLTNAYAYYFAVHQAGTSGSPATLGGFLPSTIESPSGLFLTSDRLTSGGTYETRTDPQSFAVMATPSNVVEFIQFDVSRFSWVHYDAYQPHYHYINDGNIQDIDLQLRSELGTLLNHDECGDYNLVIAFETLVEPTYSKEFLQAQANEAYTMAHTPERIIL
jgi:hypothetical protein